MTPTPNTPQEEGWRERFVEAGAALEHARWARWQNYLHSFLTWNNDIQAWVLPHELKDRWQMQINTPYQMLSEKEKESDRKEARSYLPLVEKEITHHDKEKAGEVMRRLEVREQEPREGTTYGDTDYPNPAVVYGYNEALTYALSIVKEVYQNDSKQ